MFKKGVAKNLWALIYENIEYRQEVDNYNETQAKYFTLLELRMYLDEQIAVIEALNDGMPGDWK
jgi:ppGpp synthetase/RelA/SpoT-type nucleotidyltranferase